MASGKDRGKHDGRKDDTGVYRPGRIPPWDHQPPQSVDPEGQPRTFRDRVPLQEQPDKDSKSS